MSNSMRFHAFPHQTTTNNGKVSYYLTKLPQNILNIMIHFSISTHFSSIPFNSNQFNTIQYSLAQLVAVILAQLLFDWDAVTESLTWAWTSTINIGQLGSWSLLSIIMNTTYISHHLIQHSAIKMQLVFISKMTTKFSIIIYPMTIV